MSDMIAKRNDLTFFVTVHPIKITESRKCRLHTESWGILTDYFLESVKISKSKQGQIVTVAMLRIGDRSGQITCVVKGPSTGLLFGMSSEEWRKVETLCSPGQQLFYRYFKNGINKTFGFEQKLFYNFCMTNQRNDVLVAKFQRCVNVRNKFRNEALLNVIDLRKCSSSLLDLYIEELRTQSQEVNKSKEANS